jgi:hypothetical protein
MTYNPFIHMTICDDCHKPDATNKGFIVTYWASGKSALLQGMLAEPSRLLRKRKRTAGVEANRK